MRQLRGCFYIEIINYPRYFSSISIYLSWDALSVNTQLGAAEGSLLSIIVLPSAAPLSATFTLHFSNSVITDLSIAAHTARESCTGVLSSSLPAWALSNSVLCSIILAVNFPAKVPRLLSL